MDDTPPSGSVCPPVLVASAGSPTGVGLHTEVGVLVGGTVELTVLVGGADVLLGGTDELEGGGGTVPDPQETVAF